MCLKGCELMSLKYSQQEFEEKVSKWMPTIKVTGEYIDMKKKVSVECNVCGYKWDSLARNLVGKYHIHCPGCTKGCKNNKKEIEEENRIKLERKVAEITLKANNKGILLERISDRRFKCTCINCGETWENTLSNAYQYKCKCANNINYTQEEFENIAKENFPQFIITGKFDSIKKPIKCMCKKCNSEVEFSRAVALTSTRRETQCPNCGINTKQHFIDRLKKEKPYIDIVSEFISIKDECTFYNSECGHTFTTRADKIYRTDCTICTQSNGEKTIEKLLKSLNIVFEKQKTFNECKDINKLRFDFYIPSLNTCIEYNGKQHYEPIKFFGGSENFWKSVARDNIKTEYCKVNGITLIKIPYTVENIEEYLINKLAL